MKVISFLFAITAFTNYRAFAANYWIDEGDLKAAKNVAGKNSHEKLLTLLAREDAVDLAVDLHIDLTTIGTGNEFFALNPDAKSNRAEHVIAEATVALSEKLHAMPIVFPVMQLASLEAADFVKSKQGDIRKAMGVACRKIEELLKQHPALAADYSQLKVAATKRNAAISKYTGYYTTIAKTEEQGSKNWANSLNPPLAKRFVVNGVFFNQTIPMAAISMASFEATRAMVELSLDPNTQHRAAVQKIYDDTLDATVKGMKNIVSADVDYGRGHTFYRKVAGEVVKNLMAKLSTNPQVYEEWKKVKKSLGEAVRKAQANTSQTMKRQ